MKPSKKKVRPKAKAIVPRDQLPRAISSSNVVGSAVSAPTLIRTLTFSSVSDGGQVGCRLSGTLPFITVGASITNGYGFVTYGGTRVSAIPLTPIHAGWLCPTIARLATCFTRFRWSRLRFDYHAMGSSASAVRLAFAYTMDPYAGGLPSSPGYGAYNILLTTPHSRVFSPWMDWSLTVPCSGDLCYTYSGSSTVVANTRQANAGQIVCVADADPGISYTYGVISLTFQLDLFDMLPYTPSTTALTISEPVEEKESFVEVAGSQPATVDCSLANSRGLTSPVRFSNLPATSVGAGKK